MSVQAENTTQDEAANKQKQDDFLTTMFASHQPAVAPVVGPHRKSASLAGFDPLLTPSSVSTVTTSSSIDPSLFTVPSLQALSDKGGDDTTSQPTSSEDSAAGSTPLSMFRKIKEKKGHRKTRSMVSLTGSGGAPKRPEQDFTTGSLTPPRAARKQVVTTQPTTTTTAAAPPPPPTTPSRGGMLPWRKHQVKGHRKTVSMTALPGISNSKQQQQQDWKQQQPTSSATASPVVAREQIALMSPMIQDLLKLELEAANAQDSSPPSLFAPSFSKPRPTSFLTGQEEVARSSEQDPSAWQLEIPDYSDVLTDLKLCQFMDTYGTEECLLDLNSLVGLPRMDLSQFARGDCNLTSPATNIAIAECHRPIVESLLECGNDISEVKGFFTSPDNDGSPDSRREVLIVERQNKFLCLFRGTAAEQHGKFAKHPDTVQLKDGLNASVYVDRCTAFAELQTNTFELLDKLTEENPFCDIMFAGHAFGAALATLAAYSYASTRTALRVSCVVSASPKVGLDDFRMAVHSTPNMNMWRLEFGIGRHHVRTAAHVGHVIRISPPNKDSEQPAVLAYKFGGDDENHHPLLLSSLMTKQKDKNVNDYISILEDLDKENWVKDFYKEDGAGVRGKDNEARQMT